MAPTATIPKPRGLPLIGNLADLNAQTQRLTLSCAAFSVPVGAPPAQLTYRVARITASNPWLRLNHRPHWPFTSALSLGPAGRPAGSWH